MIGPDRPVYLCLRDMISAAILEGRYRDGDPLPSVRSFAARHNANPLTVAKAYQSLQDDALVTVRRGIGTFVAEGATARLRVSERQVFLDVYWPQIERHIRRLGLDPAELLEPATAD